jgi:hypothetical protein
MLLGTLAPDGQDELVHIAELVLTAFNVTRSARSVVVQRPRFV